MALSLIEGVLRWRDAVTSLETFKFPIFVLESKDSTSLDAVATASTSVSGGSALKTFFRSLLHETVQLLREEGYRPVCEDPNSEDLADIRRVLVHRLLLFVTSDFPPSLPFVLRWLCVPNGQRQASWQGKYLAFRTLDAYLFSIEEELVADILWGGFNGVYGAPLLPQPHLRRADTESYEESCVACYQERTRLIAEEEEARNEAYAPKQEGQVHEAERYGQAQQPRPPLEAFSLSCRWDRVNSIVQGSFVGNSAGLSSKLSENEGQQNSDILQCMADYTKAFATVTGARGGSTASTEESNIVLSLAKEVLRSSDLLGVLLGLVIAQLCHFS